MSHDNEGVSGWTNTITELPDDAAFWAEMPRPAFWRILIAPIRPKEVSKGGIVLARAHQEAQEILNFLGKVVALGPQAGKHERLGGTGHVASEEFPKVGDYVVYGKYAGQPLLYKGWKLLLLNDDEILGTVPNPDTLQVVNI